MTLQPQLALLEQHFKPSPLTQILDPALAAYPVELWLKRDDLLHPIVSGNKWRKLKYLLNHALILGCDTLISMGGAYSNHLHALAYAGHCLGLNTIGLIRGEQPAQLTPSLLDMQAWGMKLQFVSRSEYRQLRHYPHWQDLPELAANQYWIPEGGAQPLALQGVGELITEIDMAYDHLCVACGTGTTLSGMIAAAPKQAAITSFAVFKHAEFLNQDVARLLGHPQDNWQINHDYHGGGFAKSSAELLAFIDRFQQVTQIAIEPVYTGKMLFGIYDLLSKGYFQENQRIIAVHTGGLQGNRGFSGVM